MQLNAKNVRGNPIREHLSIVSGSPIMYHFVLSAFSWNVFVSAPRESVSAWLNTRFRAAPRRGEHFGANRDRSSLFSSLSLGKIKHTIITTSITARWSGDVMKGHGHKNFNAVSHNRSRPKVLFFNLTWRSRKQISSVLLQLLLFAFSNRKFGRHGKWSVTFWQWENNT